MAAPPSRGTPRRGLVSFTSKADRWPTVVGSETGAPV